MAWRLHLQHALLPEGWAENVLLTVSDAGMLEAVERGPRPPEVESLAVGLPGVPNLHSHAFQRAMSGLTEVGGSREDSFWTWREVMYRFVRRVQPEHLRAIAAQAYVEMLESGFTRVCEFHYLHHDLTGLPYDDPAHMSAALVEAARDTGLGLTLLPVFYAQGGFGGEPPSPSQSRFINDEDGFGRLHDACAVHVGGLDGGVVGLAMHSLRAVAPESMDRLLELHPGGPVHIHVAEQELEVQQCLAWSNRRPVQWLLENQSLDARWCLVHATHMVPQERDALAGTGAVAGLCPLTEANLGDGIFDAVAFAAAGGRFGIGSDSNTRIGVAEELAMLEYSQRLRDRRRNRLSRGGSTGGVLFREAVSAGARASGAQVGALAVGHSADIVTLDPTHPGLIATSGDGWLDAWVLGAGAGCVDRVYVRGRARVVDGVHLERGAVASAYARAMEALRE